MFPILCVLTAKRFTGVREGGLARVVPGLGLVVGPAGWRPFAWSEEARRLELEA